MAIDTTHDLFIYELGLAGEFEASGLRTLNFLAHRVSDGDLRRIVRDEQQECVRQGENIKSCMEALGAFSLAVSPTTVDGMYGRFEAFVRTNPAPDILDQFGADTLIRFLYLGIAVHKTLIDWAILMNENQCVGCLHENLVQKKESVAKIERYSHELGVRLLVP